MDVLTRERAKPDAALRRAATSWSTSPCRTSRTAASATSGCRCSTRPAHCTATSPPGGPGTSTAPAAGLRWLHAGGGRRVGRPGRLLRRATPTTSTRFADSIRRFGADAVVVTSTDQVLGPRPAAGASPPTSSAGSDCTIVTTEVSRTQAGGEGRHHGRGAGRGSPASSTSRTTRRARRSPPRCSSTDPRRSLRALDDLRRELSHDGDGSTGHRRLRRAPAAPPRPRRHGARLAARRATGPTSARRRPSSPRTATCSPGGWTPWAGADWPVLTRWPELPAARVDAGRRARGRRRQRGLPGARHGAAQRARPRGGRRGAARSSRTAVLFSARAGRRGTPTSSTALLDENVRVGRRSGARRATPTRATRAARRPHRASSAARLGASAARRRASSAARGAASSPAPRDLSRIERRPGPPSRVGPTGAVNIAGGVSGTARGRPRVDEVCGAPGTRRCGSAAAGTRRRRSRRTAPGSRRPRRRRRGRP